MTITALRGLFPSLVLAFCGLGLSSCAGVPVQEMSDARQAVQAALGAGAAQRAPQQMSAAQSALAQAEVHLKRREFRRARHSALEARTQAIEAQRAAQDGT